MSGPFGSSQWMYTTEEYEIEKSVRLSNQDSGYLQIDNDGSTGSRTTWTISMWVKIIAQGEVMYLWEGGETDSNTNRIFARFSDIGLLRVSEASTVRLETTQKFVDPGSWHHFVFKCDTTNGTADDRFQIFHNGELITEYGTRNNFSQNDNVGIGKAEKITLGYTHVDSTLPFDGYFSEVHYVDGTALNASSFGSTDGTWGHWKPKKYGGSYGTNGFFLEFKQSGTSQNSSGIGADTSGNDKHLAVSSIATHDVMLDNPTNNFSVMASNGYQCATAFRDGGLFIRDSGTALGLSTIRPTSGKWYWEVDLDGRYSGSPYWGAFFSPDDEDGDSNDYDASSEANVKIVSYSGGANFITIEGGTLNASHGAWPADHIWGFAYDVDAGKLWISKNGDFTAVGVSGSNPSTATNPAATGLGSHCIPAFGPIGSTSTQFNAFLRANFGADGTFAGAQSSGGESDDNGYGDFKYDVPSGFLSICTKNLPEPAVKPAEYFNNVKYSGNSTDNRSITGVGFQPDWVWVKHRDHGTNHSNNLADVLRGGTKILYTNTTDAEETITTSIKSFDTDGFTLGDGDPVNDTGVNYISWNWKAGGSGSSNSNGSITSSVSAAAEAGFSIVSYTGNGSDNATVGHGLSSKPDVVLTKRRDSTSHWLINDWSGDYANKLKLNDTEVVSSSNSFVKDASSTTFTLGTDADVNANNGTYIAYCFHSVEGYCNIGKYNGNGSTDGPFVYTGFRPAWIMYKSKDDADVWTIVDSVRDPFNSEAQRQLRPEHGGSETVRSGGVHDIQFCSNGFKVSHNGDAAINANGSDFIYMAFAETPLKYANGSR